MATGRRVMIGIDPDVSDNGVCVRWMDLRFKECNMMNYRFFDLIEFLQQLYLSGCEMLLVIEAGHLNKKANFRSSKMNALSSDKVSQRVGQNNQVGILLIEYAEKYGIQYETYIPHSSNKIHKQCIEDANVFCQLTGWENNRNTNKETRSAAMLVYERSWPMKIKPVR